MKRIGTTWLTICASLGLLTAAMACSSGTTDPEAAGKGGSGSGATSGTGGSSSGATGGTSSGATSGTGGSSSGATGGTSGSSSGGTGGGTGGTSSGASVCDPVGATTPLLADQGYVDNFETEVRWLGWYAFSDTTPTANIPPLREGPGSVTTANAIHVAASAIKTPTSTPEAGYGAGVGFNMIDPALEKCKDVSAFDGISFWIKGTSGTANMVTFQVVHPATAPVADGGDCTVAAQCYLHPKKSFAVTAEWTQVTIAWADLAGSTATVTGPILGFNIITPDEEWDVWIDEVSLYSGTPPAGAVTPPDEVGAGGAGPGAGGAGG